MIYETLERRSSFNEEEFGYEYVSDEDLDDPKKYDLDYNVVCWDYVDGEKVVTIRTDYMID